MKSRTRLKEIHFYEWYISRWQTSDAHDELDATGRGIYREMLDVCYAQGAVTSNPEILCRRCACSREDLDSRWTAIRRHFQAHRKDKNKLVNKHASLVRRDYFAFIREQSRKGTKGGRSGGRGTTDKSTTSEAPAKPLLKPEQSQERRMKNEVLRMKDEELPPLPPQGDGGGDFSDHIERIRERHRRNPSQFHVGIQYLSERNGLDMAEFERVHAEWVEHWNSNKGGRYTPKFPDFVLDWKSYAKGPPKPPGEDDSWLDEIGAGA